MLSIIFSRNIKELNKKYLSYKIFQKCLSCNNLKEYINISNNYDIKKLDYNINEDNINEDNIRYYEDIYEED